jgi:hypothetical protein
MQRRSILFVLLAIFPLLHSLFILPPAATIQAQSNLVDNRFGAVEAFWAPEEAADLGIGWERILFYWNEIQPTGPDDWNTLHVLEEWLVEANAHGRTITGLLKNTPDWATDGETFAGVPNGLYLPVDSPDNLWAGYVRRVAAYYAPLGVHHWIVWNEPDISPGTFGHEFAGSVQDYYQMVKIAYRVMKEVDPEATILLAGLTYWHDPGYLRRFLEVAVADPDGPANNYYFDVISLHVYFRVETVGIIINNIWAVQNDFGISKPIWVNETNAPPNLDPQWPVARPQFQVDLEQQAWYLIQAHALAFGAGAARVAVYKLLDVHLEDGGESFGLLRPDFSQRPAYQAYQRMVQYLGGFTGPVHREQYPEYFSVLFTRPQGTTRVLWARNNLALTVQVPAQAQTALLVDPLGETSQVQAQGGRYTLHLDGARCYDGDCLIGGPPLFLVEGDNLPPAPTATALAPNPGGNTFPITMTATAVPPTLPPSPTFTPSPEATATPSSTVTDTPPPSHTPPPTPAITPSPAGEEIAQVNTVTAVPTVPNTAAPTSTPTSPPVEGTNMNGLWFLGAGVGLAILLLVGVLRRGRG